MSFDQSWYLCMDIGGTAIKYGLFCPSDLVLRQTGEMATPKGGDAILHAVASIVRKMHQESDETQPFDTVCISSAGIIDSQRGIVLEANEALMPGYTGTALASFVQDELGLRCHVENDVNCAALAEFYAGTAISCRSSFTMTVGTGIGGAYILDGRLITGHSFSAGEVGYMLMDDSSFEQLGATSALIERAAEALQISPASLDGKRVFSLAKEGNADCIRAIDQMCDVLAKGISNVCYCLNPEIVVIGGGISAQQDVLRPRLERGLDRYLIPFLRCRTRLAFAARGNQAGLMGACYAYRTSAQSALSGADPFS